jgi:hypothetical protein
MWYRPAVASARHATLLLVIPVLSAIVSPVAMAQSGQFDMGVWTGAWGSDGPINVGDLNGDGRSDVFMWRDGSKDWTVNLSTAAGFQMQRWTGAWGSDGAINVGDLNGDGRTDVFMWRDGSKDWTVNLSTGSGFQMAAWKGAWGSDGPIRVGDLNGDGRTDVFMWREANHDWMVNLSTGSGFDMQSWTGAWGSDGPINVGDLNGDGRTDVFMWRESNHDWMVNLSTGSGFDMQSWNGAWGSDGPIFVGDLNRDGRSDVFMWRAGSNDWTVNLSTGSGFQMGAWAGAWGSDGPINIGDLNGDGRTDVFMWRAGSNDWTVNLSTGSGFQMAAWAGAWGSDGPINVGDLNGDGRTDVFMWRENSKDWTVNLAGPAFPAYHRLAEFWAPVYSHDVDMNTPQAEYLTRIDYDGDWIGRNNAGNLFDYPLRSVVYWWVRETQNAWYIGYAMYHPRDWTNTGGPAAEHDHDLEAVLLAVAKDPSQPFGRFLTMVTVGHFDFYSYTDSDTPEGYNLGPLLALSRTITGGEGEDIDGDVDFVVDDRGLHPVAYIEAEGHGTYGTPRATHPDVDDYDPMFMRNSITDWRGVNWTGLVRPPVSGAPQQAESTSGWGDGVLYHYEGVSDIASPAHAASRSSLPHDWEVIGYDLVSIQELWARRNDFQSCPADRRMFDGYGEFAPKGANAPWNWNDAGVESTPKGAYFLAPADLMEQYFNGLPAVLWPSPGGYVGQSIDDEPRPAGTCG